MYPDSLPTKCFALRFPRQDICELSISTDKEHKVYNLSFAQLRLLVLEGARGLAVWPEEGESVKKAE